MNDSESQQPRPRPTPLWVTLFWITAGLMGLRFYVLWLENHWYALGTWFEQYPAAQWVLGLLSCGLASVAAIAMRSSSRPKLAWPVALVVGALVNAPSNSAYGFLLAVIGAWLTRRLPVISSRQHVLKLVRYAWHSLLKRRPGAIEWIVLAYFAMFSWLIYNGQFNEWRHYLVSARPVSANSFFDVIFHPNSATIFSLMASVVICLMTQKGRKLLRAITVGVGSGFLASVIAFHFDQSQQLRVGSLLLVLLLVTQMVIVVRNATGRATTPPMGFRMRVARCLGLLLLCLIFWPSFWVGLQFDTIRRISSLSAHAAWLQVEAARSPTEYMLGLGHVHHVYFYERATAAQVDKVRGFPFVYLLDFGNGLDADAVLSKVTRELTNCHATELTVEQCRDLGQMPYLAGLSFKGLSDEKLAHVMKAPLNELTVEEGSLSLAGMQSLRSSTLTFLLLKNVSLTDEHLKHLPAMPSLAGLYLNDNQIRGETLDQLARHAQLSQLSLDNNPILEPAIAKLAALRPLYSLSLNGINLSRVNPSLIANLPVVDLSLQQTGISDDWICDFVIQMKPRPANAFRLQTLKLYGNAVSTETQKALVGFAPMIGIDDPDEDTE